MTGISLVFAAFLRLTGPRRTANDLLALLLLLTAGNQGIEKDRVLADSPAARDAWLPHATTLAALAPVFLYYFASVYPDRVPLRNSRRFYAIFASGGPLALLPPWAGYPIPGGSLSWTRWLPLELFAVVVRTRVLLRFLERLRNGAAEERLDSSRCAS